MVPALSIAENMFANRPPTNAVGVVRWVELYHRASELLTELNLAVDVRRSVASVDAGTRQLVEIAKALSLQARVLLLDEPTSALTPHDVQTLFGLLRRLRAAGITIVYVSHQMREVFAIADRITVMRDGCKVGTSRTEQISAGDVIRHMVGREVIDEKSRAATAGGERLGVEALTAHGHFRDINFAVREGEIVGLAGKIGSGRSELVRVIGGARIADRGRVRIDRRAVSFRSVRDAMRCGVAYLPGERKTEGLFLSKSLSDNVVAPSLGRVTSFGVISRSKCKRMASEVVRLLRIRAAGIGQPVARLSGGNQQKVLLGKWLTIEPRILVVDEPTKGVDVAAKSEAQRQRDEGAARLEGGWHGSAAGENSNRHHAHNPTECETVQAQLKQSKSAAARAAAAAHRSPRRF